LEKFCCLPFSFIIPCSLFDIPYFAGMKSVLTGCFLCLQFFYACSDADKTEIPTSENDLDAARNFIDAALDGHYDDARPLVLPDSVNQSWIDLFRRNYQENMSLADKAGYRDASINIHNVQALNDSTTIVHYSNSYKKKEDSLKVVRRNGVWLVDLAYSFPSPPTGQMP
jgi:hypothetical protein